MLRIAAACAALLLSACAMNQQAGVAPLDLPEVQPGDISVDTLRDVTRTLSSDRFDGRMPGTEGERLTLDYLVERFKAAGLQPGNHGSWFQDVPLVEIEGINQAPLTVKNGETQASFSFGDQWVGVTYRENQRIDLKDSELVFVGYGIYAPEKGWNDYAGIDMHGKTAVILVNDPDWASEELTGPFNGRAMTYYAAGPTNTRKPHARARRAR
jgi:hypothetical protein